MAGTAYTRGVTKRSRAHLRALLACTFFTFAALPHADAAPIQAEVATSHDNGFVRLVFRFSSEVEPDVRLANNVLVVNFGRTVDINVDQIAVNARGYVSVARRDPDGTALRMALSRKVLVNTMAAGERFYVDLLPDTWQGVKPGLPQEVVDDLARRAREAEKQIRKQKQAEQRQRFAPIRVRLATLPTLTRYLFELPPLVGVNVARTGETLKLSFSAPLKFDLADVKGSLPPEVRTIDAESEGEDDGAVLRITLIGSPETRTFRDEKDFVIDVGGKPDAPRAGSVRLPLDAQGAKGKPPIPEPVVVKETAPTPEPAKTARSDTPNPVADHPKNPPNAPVAARPDPNAPVNVVGRRQGDTVRLTFPFASVTPAAAFRRGGVLWLVFDTVAPVNVAALRQDTSNAVREVVSERQGDAHVLGLKLDRPYLASLAADGSTWVLTLADTVTAPAAPLSVVRELDANSHPVAVIRFDEARAVHRLKDPEAGDDLTVVTSLAPPKGVVRAQEFIDFRVLPSTHGVVLQTIADDTRVQLSADRLIVSRPGGLTMTASGEGASPLSLASKRAPPLNAQVWKDDRQQPFAARHTALISAAGDAPENKKTQARFDLARFYLAREYFAEAKGVLDVALAGDRDPEATASGLLLRGVANLMLGRDEQALKDFANPALGNQYDAPLWRSIALSRQGRWSDAREGFRNVEMTTSGMPLELQRLAIAEAVRCALELGDFAEASRRVNVFEGVGTPTDMAGSLATLNGRLAEGMGRTGDALTQYKIAAESTSQPVAMQGRLRRLLLRFALRDISRADLTTELEAIAAAWRGDATELEALQVLARLYTDEKRYRPAFEIMRVAVAVFGKTDVARRIQEDAATTFEALFASDLGHSLPPSEALGLFYDFHMLTPPGRRGDDMIRRLADRLIGVDLLTQAGELLQHQVDHRLAGAARAQAGTRLAFVYLADRKPDRALRALRTTRGGEVSTELRAERLLLEARAMSEIGRHDLALEIAQEIKVPEAERLRGDILWSARRWREAAEQVELIQGERWRDPKPLAVAERSDVLRAAIGYALAEDMLGLDRLRQKYAPRMAETPDARMFDVVTISAGARPDEFVEAAKAASSVDTLTAFLDDVRKRFGNTAAVPSAETPRS